VLRLPPSSKTTLHLSDFSEPGSGDPEELEPGLQRNEGVPRKNVLEQLQDQISADPQIETQVS